MPRNFKQEYKTQQERGEHENRMERQRARRKLDAKGVTRHGKDVAHVKALSKGGSNADGVCLLYTSDRCRRIERCRSRWSPYH